jgi:uncharacterized coiled-coil DUF342 family protein
MQKKISELQSAELKLRALLNKRDEINEQAFVLRSERDSLNEKKRELQQRLREVRDKRDALVAQMRVHKAKRDELQKKAKELIAYKKGTRGRPLGDLKGEIRAASADAKMMELQQQTVPMSLPKERELLEKIKAKLTEVDRFKKLLAEEEKVQKEVRGVDQNIDTLFKFADKEHELVVKFSEESQKHHDENNAIMKDIAALAAAADKKHEDFIKLKEDADAVHQKAQDLRGKVIEIKGEKRADRQAEREAIRTVNQATRKALDDKDKKDKAAEDALQTLLKKGKVQIR